MFKRLLSLSLPVMLSAVAALTFLHFRRAGIVEASPALQVAQADPADPFAPVPPAVPPRVDPAAPPAVEPKPAVPPANKPVRSKRVRRATPQADDEVRTPFLKSLLGQLDSFTEVSAEDRDSVRQMIYDADVELSDSMGPAALRRIQAANRKRTFVVGPSAPRTATGPTIKREDVLNPKPRVGPGEVQPAKPVDPIPAPAEAPKKDVFDNLFE